MAKKKGLEPEEALAAVQQGFGLAHVLRAVQHHQVESTTVFGSPEMQASVSWRTALIGCAPHSGRLGLQLPAATDNFQRGKDIHESTRL